MAKGFRQASIANSWRPMRRGVNSARQRSFSNSCIRTSCHSSSSAGRHRSTAASGSWPSPKMSASTRTVSPTTRFTTKRPSSTEGVIFSIARRGAAAATARFGSEDAERIGLETRPSRTRTSAGFNLGPEEPSISFKGRNDDAIWWIALRGGAAVCLRSRLTRITRSVSEVRRSSRFDCTMATTCVFAAEIRVKGRRWNCP